MIDRRRRRYTEPTFEVGKPISWHGCNGHVLENDPHKRYPVKFMVYDKNDDVFVGRCGIDGKYNKWDRRATVRERYV